MEAFRDGKASFLLATDLASRGLDIKGVDTVINYEAPQSHEIYLHRVGRTARAGRSGRSSTLAAEPDRKIVKAAVKSGRAQGAKIVSRQIEAADADTWAEKIADFEDEIEEILKDEKEEKVMAQAEMEVRKGENIIAHEGEIKGRPRRTWFESEQEKSDAKKKGKAELNGVDIQSILKKKPGRLSNKDKKKLDDRDIRTEGKVWKKGRAERDGKGALEKAKAGKGKKKVKGGKPVTKFGKKR
jgi:ATP-dependent RNA helicase DDX27